MENKLYESKEAGVNDLRKFKNYFTFEVKNQSLIVEMRTNKIDLFYRKLKYFMKNYFNSIVKEQRLKGNLKDDNLLKSFRINLNDKIDIKSKMMLVYCLLKCEILANEIFNQNIKFKIMFGEFNLNQSRNYLYLSNCNKYNKYNTNLPINNEAYLITDFLMLKSNDLVHNNNINNVNTVITPSPNKLFLNTVEYLTKNIKNITYLRLPCLEIHRLESETHILKQTMTQFIKFYSQLKFVSLNMNYSSNPNLVTCALDNNIYAVLNSLVEVILMLANMFKDAVLILNIYFCNVDECFPICELVEQFMLMLNSQIFCFKFLINFKCFCTISHYEENQSVFSLGKSINMNKIFIKSRDNDFNYLIMHAIKKSNVLKKLNQSKFIKSILAKYLLNFKIYHFDKFAGNESSLELDNTLNGWKNEIESIDTSKMILFCKSYNPLEIF